MVAFWKATFLGFAPKYLGMTWMDGSPFGGDPQGVWPAKGWLLHGAPLAHLLPPFTHGKCFLHGYFWYFEYPSYPLVFL